MSWKKALVRQFHKPKGVMGAIAGQIMASRASNLERNRWTLELLELNPTDRVLELGPGPGVTLRSICERTRNGFVVGVDHSPTMLSQCRLRNLKALKSGRLSLIEGDITRLPLMPCSFDKILAVNSLQFDGLTSNTFRDVAERLAPGGVFAVTFQPRDGNSTNEQALASATLTASLLQEAGLANTRIETLPLEPVCAVCVLASNRATVIADPHDAHI